MLPQQGWHVHLLESSLARKQDQYTKCTHIRMITPLLLAIRQNYVPGTPLAIPYLHCSTWLAPD
jgi:hypothetical protein